MLVKSRDILLKKYFKRSKLYDHLRFAVAALYFEESCQASSSRNFGIILD